MVTDKQSDSKELEGKELPVMPGEAELLAALFDDVLNYVTQVANLDD